MQIVKISDSTEVQQDTNKLVVGIDFGTTNSLIAISDKHQSKIIKMQDGTEIVPSIIGFDDNNKVIVGSQALECNNRIRSIKRLLAKSYDEIKSHLHLFALGLKLYNDSGIPRIECLGGRKTLPEISSKIFLYLREQAQISLGVAVRDAVVSVPAYFGDEARGQILFAAKLAGFNVIRLISEPTAAAYAYGLNKLTQGSYLVYDLGGGTFDVSILNMYEGVLQVIATGGDSMFGGDDIDYAIAQYISHELGCNISDKLLDIAKKIKEDFLLYDTITLPVEGLNIVITKDTYQNIISPLISQTIKIAQEVLSDAEDIKLDGIILAGGSTRITLISEQLDKAFKTRIYNDIDPDKVVALGTALQGENLTTKSNTLLIDAVPLSIGLELHGGITEKIITRNTPIPFFTTQVYTTHTDNQTGMKFHVVQGEREMAKDCRSLAQFELTGICPCKAGVAKIQVKFAIDADGILSVSALDKNNGKAHHIEIKPSYGLNQSSINDMLNAAYINAAHDHRERLLVEAKESGQSLIQGILSAISSTPDILNDSECNEIYHEINALRDAICLENYDNILLKINKLNQITSGFIQKHLNQGASLFLNNKNINEINID